MTSKSSTLASEYNYVVYTLETGYRSMRTRGKWIKLISKTLKALKEKYEGKSSSIIIGSKRTD